MNNQPTDPHRSAPWRLLQLEVMLNVVFSVLRAVLLLWLIRLAGQAFTPAVLSLFLLGRRHITTISAFLAMGSTQTIQRYLPLNVGDKAVQQIYFFLPLSLLLLASMVLVPLGWALKERLANILFADPTLGELAFLVLLSALLAIFGALVLSTLMALRRFYTYNLINLVIPGILPIIGVLAVVADPSAERALWITSGLAGLCTTLASVMIMRDLGLATPTWEGYCAALRTFKDFGLPRTLSVGFDAATLTIGAWWLLETPQAATSLIVALTLFRLVQMLLAPASQVLGIASLHATQGASAKSAISRRAIIFALWTGILSLTILQPWLEPILQLWLGNTYLAEGSLEFARIIIWGLPFTVLFYSLRGIIEIRWMQPLNLITQITSLISFFVVVMFFADTIIIVVIANTLMLMINGLLSLFWLRGDFPKFRELALPRLLGLGSILFITQTIATGLPSLVGVTSGLLALVIFGLLALRQVRQLIR
jgi:hypothetical protein